MKKKNFKLNITYFCKTTAYMNSPRKLFIFFLFNLLFVNTIAQKKNEKEIDDALLKSDKITDGKKSLELKLNILEKSKAQNYKTGQAKALLGISKIYLENGEHKKTLDTSEELLDIGKSTKDHFFITQAYLIKTLSYSYMGFFEDAKESLLKAEQNCNKMFKDDLYYRNMGQVYSIKSEMLNLQYAPAKEKLVYDLKSIESLKKIKNTEERDSWLTLHYSSIGNTYLELKDYEKSLDYNRKAYQLGVKTKDSVGLAFGLNGIANNYSAIKKNDSAIYYYEKAISIFSKRNDIYRLQYIYTDLTNIYGKLGNQEKYKFYHKLADSLSEEITKIEKLEINQISNDIINSEKTKWNKNLMTIYIIIIVVGLIFLFLLVNYMKNYKKEKSLKEKSNHNLLENEKKINLLETKINEAFSEVVELAKKDDSSFLTRFIEVYPEFHNTLTTNYPDMTSGQIKFCAMLKLNFTTKEIAHYQHITVRSVEMKKNRLRKQLNIPSNIELNNWANNI